jgi:hypothetical protein
MKDVFEELVGYLLWVSCVIVALAMLPGCTNKVADISIAPPTVTTCPSLALPPVPADVVLDIRGDKVISNEGGDVILRGYVQARSLLRPAHAK